MRWQAPQQTDVAHPSQPHAHSYAASPPRRPRSGAGAALPARGPAGVRGQRAPQAVRGAPARRRAGRAVRQRVSPPARPARCCGLPYALALAAPALPLAQSTLSCLVRAPRSRSPPQWARRLHVWHLAAVVVKSAHAVVQKRRRPRGSSSHRHHRRRRAASPSPHADGAAPADRAHRPPHGHGNSHSRRSSASRHDPRHASPSPSRLGGHRRRASAHPTTINEHDNGSAAAGSAVAGAAGVPPDAHRGAAVGEEGAAGGAPPTGGVPGGEDGLPAGGYAPQVRCALPQRARCFDAGSTLPDTATAAGTQRPPPAERACGP